MDAATLRLAFEDLGLQISKLTAVEWGFAVIVVLTALTWVWVMGAPRGSPHRQGVVAAVLGLAVVAAALLICLAGGPARAGTVGFDRAFAARPELGRNGVRAMPRGDKSKYTDKQDRKADHIAESYESRGVGADEAERRAWATVNKRDGGGKRPGGAGRGHDKA